MNLLAALRLGLDPSAPDVVAFVGAGGKSTALFRLAEEIVDAGRRVITTTTTRIAADQIRLAPVFVPVIDDNLPVDLIGRELDRHSHCLLIGRADMARGAGAKKAGIHPALVDALAASGPALDVSAILIEADGSRMLPAKAPDRHEPALPRSTTLMVPIIGMDALGAPIDEAHVQRAALIRRVLGLPDDACTRLTPAQMARLLTHPDGGAKGRSAGMGWLPLINQADDPPRLAAARLIAAELTRSGVGALIGTLDAAGLSPIRERWAPVAVIVLAAGGSARMATPKQLLTIDGEPMVRRALRTALQSDADRVILVTGAHKDKVDAAVRLLPPGADGRLRVVHNGAWARGQATSLHAGLGGCGDGIGAALFMPADQPRLDAAILRRLIGRWRETGAPVVAPRVDGELRGAPALFERSLWPELMAITGDVGGRPVLRRHLREADSVAVAAGQLVDIDTPADLAALYDRA